MSWSISPYRLRDNLKNGNFDPQSKAPFDKSLDLFCLKITLEV